MAEIFISYKSERRKAAEHLAAVLERYGFAIWFDYQLIKGRDFGLQIDQKVRAVKALIVLMRKIRHSLTSITGVENVTFSVR